MSVCVSAALAGVPNAEEQSARYANLIVGELRECIDRVGFFLRNQEVMQHPSVATIMGPIWWDLRYLQYMREHAE